MIPLKKKKEEEEEEEKNNNNGIPYMSLNLFHHFYIL